MNFPNLDELSFFAVLALPNASKIGFEENIRFYNVLYLPPFIEFYEAIYFNSFLVDSVFPAPLSPLTTTEQILFSFVDP